MPSQQTPAYALWERINRELSRQGLTQAELVLRTGVPAKTLNHLRVSTRPPAARIVNAIADALGIDREEAAELGGRIPPRTTAPTNSIEAIRNDPRFTEGQRRALLEIAETFDAANAAAARRPSAADAG